MAAVIGGVVLLSGASIWGLAGLTGYFDASADQYEHLRQVYEIGHHAATARRLIHAAEPDRAAVLDALNAAAAPPPEGNPPHAKIEAALREAAVRVTSGAPLDQAAPQINIALNQVTDLAQQIKGEIVANREAASAHLTALTVAMGVLSLAVIIAAMVLGRSQYRTMQQLVRAERLASLGYLAAGAAHEINNPLAIIGGYAEAALRQMRAPGDGQGTMTAERALNVIVEQAFRCTAITSQLLTLAAPRGKPRAAVAVGPLLKRVSEVISGLPQFGQRHIDVAADERELSVVANEQELTQVVTNLLTNAVDATSAQTGRIRIEAVKHGRRVIIRISDNGRGMPPEVVRRVFEPFYADRPRRSHGSGGSTGTGLGLAVSQAIVEQHGGRIAAESEGEGRGSTFIVELPATAAGDAHA